MPSLQSIVTTSFLTGWLDLRRATSVAHSSALSTRHLGLRRDTYYVGSKQRGTRPFSALVPGRRAAFAPAVKATAGTLIDDRLLAAMRTRPQRAETEIPLRVTRYTAKPPSQ